MVAWSTSFSITHNYLLTFRIYVKVYYSIVLCIGLPRVSHFASLRVWREGQMLRGVDSERSERAQHGSIEASCHTLAN
jgi:hypothetical protein